jgi:hypothetical protein
MPVSGRKIINGVFHLGQALFNITQKHRSQRGNFGFGIGMVCARIAPRTCGPFTNWIPRW